MGGAISHLFGGLTQPGSALQSPSGQTLAVGAPQQMLGLANQSISAPNPSMNSADPLGLSSVRSTGAPPSLPPFLARPGENPVGDVSQSNPSMDALAANRNLPTFKDATFSQASHDSLGMPTAASPALSTKGKVLQTILQGGLGALAGRAASEQALAESGGRRNGGFGSGAIAGMNLPFQQAGQRQAVQRGGLENEMLQNQVRYAPLLQALGISKTQAEIGKTTAESQKASAEGQKATAETGAIPVKTALEQAQAEAANFKEDPNVGLVDIRTGKPISGDAASAPLTPEEATVLGKQPGDRVPLKLKNTANEILNRGVHMAQANGRSMMVDSQGNTIKDLGTANPIVLNQIQQGGFAGSAKVPAGISGAGVLDYLDPSSSALVQMIGDGKMDFQLAASRMNPQAKGNLAAYVHAYNPDFDQKTYTIAKQAGEAFTSGSQGQQLMAINTSRYHMQTFIKLAQALNNGNVQLLNQAKQLFKTQFGSEAPTDFGIAKQAFSGEVGKAFAGANVAEGDRKEVGDAINKAESWPQLLGAANTADELLAGKQKSMKESYDAAQKGKPNFGKGATSNAQAEADQFLKKHKIQ